MTTFTSRPSKLALLLSLLAPLAGFAQSATSTNATLYPLHKVEAGLTYSSGDYGLTEDTEVFAAPFTYVLEHDRWSLRATIPWVSISGPATVVGGGSGSTGGPLRPTTASESGIGDSTLALSYQFNPSPDAWNVDGTVRAKFPTGDDERGIGTGEMDYFAQFDFYRTYGSITPFGAVGYRFLGDGRYQLDDGFYASLGSLFTLAPGRNLAVAIDWRDRLVAGVDDALEASVFILNRHSDRWNSAVGVLTGFNDSSLNYGLAGSLSYTF